MSKLGRIYPEIEAGGFSREDGTVAFYTRVNALLAPEMTVLDFGAGRGQQMADAPNRFKMNLARLQGKVAKVVGADVDDAVLENPYLDEKHVIRIGEPLPFADARFDLVLADWVLEHVANPEEFSEEVARVTRPGGWFCARTPNRWGLTGLSTNLIPNRHHVGLLSKIQPDRKDIDVFPTAYKLNTRRQVKQHFRADLWDDYSFIDNGDPPYVQNSVLAMRAVQAAWRLLPAHFYTVMYIFMQRRPT